MARIIEMQQLPFFKVLFNEVFTFHGTNYEFRKWMRKVQATYELWFPRTETAMQGNSNNKLINETMMVKEFERSG